MKLNKISLLFISVLLSVYTFSQIPASGIRLQSLNGKQVVIDDYFNENSLIVISFWATWCKPCIDELEAIAEEYEIWQEETGVKILAVSIDDSRSASKVKALVNGRNWDYEILLDQNQELQRFFNSTNIPFIVILKEGEIAWKHSGYIPGDEAVLYEKLIELSK